MFSIEFLVDKISSNLSFDKNIVSKWYNTFRAALERYIEDCFQKIDGEGHEVQIDETVIAKRKYNRGRIVPQQWLFGAIDTVTNHCILRYIDD